MKQRFFISPGFCGIGDSIAISSFTLSPLPPSSAAAAAAVAAIAATFSLAMDVAALGALPPLLLLLAASRWTSWKVCIVSSAAEEEPFS